MRTIFLLMSLWVLPFGLYGQWEIVHENVPWIDHAQDLAYLTKDTWIFITASDSNKITTAKTFDAGKNWELFVTEITCSIPIQAGSYSFLNDTTGWFTSNEGLFHTGDGGRNWVLVNDSNCADYKIFVRSENCLYLGGPELYRSADGGLSFNKITPVPGYNYSSACFRNSDTCIVCAGNAIIKTFNGGRTWIKKHVQGDQNIYNLKLINDSAGYFVTYAEAKGCIIYTTQNLFVTWSTPYSTLYPVESCIFFNKDDGLAVIQTEDNTHLMRTTTGGVSWEQVDSVTLRKECTFFNSTGANSVVLTGSFSSGIACYKSENMGINWEKMQFNYPSFNGICISEDSTVFVSASYHFLHGAILDVFKCEGPKVLWRFNYPGFDAKSCRFLRSGHGIALLTNRWTSDLIETWDLGDSWSGIDRLPGQGPRRYRSIFFVDGYKWFANEGRSVYCTENRGITWSCIFSFEDQQGGSINSIYFHSAQKGVATGDSGLIIKYDQEQGWTRIACNSTLPLNKVFFSDSTYGWITGGFMDQGAGLFSPLILKTFDGGTNWTDVTLPDYFIHDLYFKDSLNGWAVGEDSLSRGMILRTDDGGWNWKLNSDTLSAPLDKIEFKNGYGWAVGGNGLILRMIDTSYVADTSAFVADTSISTVDTNSSFIQLPLAIPPDQLNNYPNPFTSGTIISYRLRLNSDIELSVYDMLGRQVSVLVNEYQQAGSYEIEWDAAVMKPGIYFCVLKAGPFRQTNKMILIK